MNKPDTMSKTDLKPGTAKVQQTKLDTPTDLKAEAVKAITTPLNAALADVFALYLKTKNFHWHMSGRIFATIICCSTSSPTRFLP